MRHVRHSFDSFALTRLIASLTFVALLAACGEPDGTIVGSSGAPVAKTGSVSVFLTDAPSDDFDQILVTINELKLIGDGPAVTIFTGEETIDLKDLENFSDLFVYADEVPIGTFSKIRMGVSQIQLVRDGDVPEIIDVEVPASGKIDLLPKGGFGVRNGLTLVIEIDFDAKKSIHVVGTGSGKYKFRPVVFVSIKETTSPARLARVHGTIARIHDDESFELCSEIFMASREVSRPSTDGGDGGIGDRHRCMLVEYDDATGIFDSNGDPATPDSLGVEDEITVIGRFHMVDDNHGDDVAAPLGVDSGAEQLTLSSVHFARHDKSKHYKNDRDGSPLRGSGKDDADTDDGDDDADTDTDTDDDTDTDGGSRPEPPDRMLVLVAFVIESGPAGTFLELRGTIETELEEGDEFDFLVDPGQGFGEGSVLRSLLQIGTRIFTKSGHELDDSDILPDTLAKIDGVLFVDMDSSLYKTALLILDIDAMPTEEVKGEIVDIDDDLLRLEIDPDDVSEPNACVFVPEDARIIRINDGEGDDRSEEIEFSDLRLGMSSDSFGEFDLHIDCLVADTVLVFGKGVEPVECSANDVCDFDEFCNKNELTCEGTGVCDETPIVCPGVFDPACGCDGRTYGSVCEANAAGISVESVGSCGDPGEFLCGGEMEIACVDDGDVCYIAPGQCDGMPEGVCVQRPDACDQIDDPVCGCDGTTYDNTCEALRAGVPVESKGACRDIGPVADAGTNQTVATGDSVTLDGSGSSDPNMDPLSYSWTQTAGPTVALTGADTVSPSFTAPSISTILTFELTVSNGSLSDTDSVDVIVEANAAPVADAGTNQTVAAGDSVTLDGSGSSDPNMDPLSYSWTQTAGPTVTLTGADTVSPSFTAPSTSTTLTFELTVSDGSLSDTDSVDVIVEANAAPVADAGTNQTVAAGDSVTLDGSGSSDPNMDPLSYSWTQTAGPTVALTGADTVSPSFTAPSTSTTLTFELTVSDGSLSDTDSVDVVVEAASLVSYAADVNPIWSARNCTNCHPNSGGLDLSGPPSNSYPEVIPLVDLNNPANSEILTKPLATIAGGINHGGGTAFQSTSDPDYQTILLWITQGALSN